MLMSILIKALKTVLLSLVMAMTGCSLLTEKPQQVVICETTPKLNSDYYLQSEYDGVQYATIPEDWLKLLVKEKECLRHSLN